MSLRPAAIRVPAEGAQLPADFNADKTGTGLRPVMDEAGNITGYVEVARPRVTAITPKYLIGTGPCQGIVKLYNPVLAQNKNYRPSNSLPPAHVKSAKAAAQLDHETTEAQRRYAEQTKRQRLQEQAQEAITLEERRRTLLAQPEIVDLQEQLEDGYNQIAGVENIEELQEFCDANDVAIQLDPAEDLELLRATVRGMFEQHIENLVVKQAGPKEPAAEGDEDPLLTKARDLVLETGKTNTSFLKQKLGVGFAKATELLDKLEVSGVVGPKGANGRRDVLKQAA